MIYLEQSTTARSLDNGMKFKENVDLAIQKMKSLCEEMRIEENEINEIKEMNGIHDRSNRHHLLSYSILTFKELS